MIDATIEAPDEQRVEQAARTIQQRVFDAFPEPPESITIGRLYLALPYLDCRSIQYALVVLKRSTRVEKVVGRAYTYRRVENASRPGDARGGPRHRLRPE